MVVGDFVFHGLDDGSIAVVSASSGRLRWRTRSALGAIGPFTPDGELLLVPAEGTRGGMLGFRHDPSGRLLDVPSPSSFQPGIALRNFGAAFVVMFLVLLGVFRFVWRRAQSDLTGSEGDS